MPRRNNNVGFVSNLIPSFFIILFLSIGFVPNLEAVDKIAPQWLLMSVLNLFSLIYILINRDTLLKYLTKSLCTTISLTYTSFIIWAAISYFYAINSTEVIVNITRQVNVLFMFVNMGVFISNIKTKMNFVSYLITAILMIEVYAVLNEALMMIKSSGYIESGSLKGVTANRNITAFSLAIKIPFVLFLIYISPKNLHKWIFGIIIFLTIFGLLMIQSRASFIAIGFILIAHLVLCIKLYLTNNKIKFLILFAYLFAPFLIAIGLNQILLKDKGANALERASTISLNTNDGSVNQRLRYYEDVLLHMKSNPILGVGLGNWKIKSIDYDSEDIEGYVVPYHAHSDFIQLGAELGVFGFLLYLGIFLLAIYFVYKLLRFSDYSENEKVFLFLMLIAIGVYSIDANLNFPIARPQVLVVWAMILALINFYYSKYFNNQISLNKGRLLSYAFLAISLFTIIPSIFVTNKVYKSLKAQMFLLQDFNSNSFNVPMNMLDQIVPDIPNITVTTIPINSVKARYYVNAKKYDKAIALIEKGTNANPYLYYSELLKSQVFYSMGRLDSAKVYAKKAFFGLPNNTLHTSNYLNIISQTRDREALDGVFELLTRNNNYNNWKNYLILASQFYPKGNQKIITQAKKADSIFPNDPELKNLYRAIAIGQLNADFASEFSNQALELFNKGDYENAAIKFELAIEKNPLEYSYYENASTSNYLIGNFDKALYQINKVINEMNQLNGKCEFIKALIFIKIGDPIGACPLFEISRDSGYSQANKSFNQYCNQ